MKASKVKRPQSSPFLLIAAILGAPVVTILLVCIKGTKKTTNRLFSSTNLKGPKGSKVVGYGVVNALLVVLFQQNRCAQNRPADDLSLKKGKNHVLYIKHDHLSINIM